MNFYNIVYLEVDKYCINQIQNYFEMILLSSDIYKCVGCKNFEMCDK